MPVLEPLLRLLSLGVKKDDLAVERNYKRLFTMVELVCGTFGFCWGALYAYFGHWLSALFPWLFVVFAIFGISHMGIKKQRELNQFCFLIVMAVCPMGIHIVEGGFHRSSGVMMWSLVVPVAFVTFGMSLRYAFSSYSIIAILCIIFGCVESRFPTVYDQLPSAVITVFYVMNITCQGMTFLLATALSNYLFEQEQAKFMQLLKNTLPASIIDTLLHAEADDPRTKVLIDTGNYIRPNLHSVQELTTSFHEDVFVLFADIVGFTMKASQVSAVDLVRVLNKMVCEIDQYCDAEGLEKIKTIGDAYMCARIPSMCKQPKDTPRQHAERTLRLGINILELAPKYCISNCPLEYRVGIGRGPAVTGLIGQSKFAFDIWGDTVNLASRMESTGLAGHVQISQNVYDVIDRNRKFTERVVNVKGKGPLPAFVTKPSDPLLSRISSNVSHYSITFDTM